MRRVIVLCWLALAAGGCGGRCAEIAAQEHALLARAAVAPGPHAQVRIPLARANELLAALIRERPIRVAVPLPRLGPFSLPIRELTAVTRDVVLRGAPADRARFGIRIELDDGLLTVTTLALEVEVTPRLVRSADAAELIVGFGPDSVVAVTPELGPDAGQALLDAVRRWLPAVGDHVPRVVLDRAAAQLASYLTGEAYQVLRTTLLRRLGELTTLRVRLPALPIARTAIRTTAEAMTIDVTTDLPVRRGLAMDGAGDEVTVRISASTAAELANWGIAHGHLPARYTRELEPRADGEYRPIFDYVDGDRRPAKLHIFQQRGGCSYFQVGLRFQIAVMGNKLEVTTMDRLVESARASAPLEVGLWLKQLLQGPIDSSYRAAAHTELTIGDRHLVTRVVRAAVVGDDVEVGLQLAPTRPIGQ